MEVDFAGTTIDGIRSDTVKDDLKLYRNGILSGSGPWGLWVYGERGAGSSLAAKVAVNRLLCDNPHWDYAAYKAKELMDSKREQWELEKNPARFEVEELIQDYWKLDSDFIHLWKTADIVWIDDLHDTGDMSFWIRHLQSDMEARVKDRKPTVVATNMAPNHRVFEHVTRVIEDRFVVVHATR